MCGIAGILYSDKNTNDPSRIKSMTDSMAHRGPDADGYYIQGRVALGHRRLSIIDLSETANQPMTDASGRFVMVYNGEIYNFRDIRKKLEGYPFRTSGDSEVILAAFSRWGKSGISMLDGMFALAIYDTQTDELVLARDRMGVKPLYYSFQSDNLVFASEIRAILKSGMVIPELDPDSLVSFLSFQSVCAPHGMIRSIRQLEAGTFMVAGKNKKEIHEYWNITSVKPNEAYDSVDTIRKRTRQLLTVAVEKRMISDVPLGAFLSGGIDSSAVVALMAERSPGRVNTFTVGFEEPEFDERPYAELVSKKFNTCHQSILLKPEKFLEELVPALDSMDIPSGDGINTYVVSKAIRQSGLTVALSGIGGDELFAGYPFFKTYLQLCRLKKFWKVGSPLRYGLAALLSAKRTGRYNRLRQLLKQESCDIGHFYPIFRQLLSPDLLKKLTSGLEDNLNHAHILPPGLQMPEHFPALSQVSIAEFCGYTQHTLLKDTDQMSMASSLEVREPFFDRELVEYVLGIPDKFKYPVYPKALLVDSMGDALPDIIVRRKKQGFVIPWELWMKKELHSFCRDMLLRISERPFIRGESLMYTWNRFLKGDPDIRWMELWLFVILEYWIEKNEIA